MAPELLTSLLHYRVDAALVVLGAVAGALRCRKHLKAFEAASDFPRVTIASVIGLAVTAAVIAEWYPLALGQAAVSSAPSVALARAAVLVPAALIGAILLVSSARFACLRAELRAHAEIERQLQQAKVAAEDANRAKSDFLAVISHEIRTPLNAVMGFANLLAESRLDEAQRDYVATIAGEGRRLSGLINDILDLSKIEEGRLTLERLPFAPAETAEEVLRLFAVRAQEKKVELRFEAQVAGPLLVAGDPLRFRQVIVNLIDNALKFTARGSVTLFLRWTPPASADTPGRLGVSVRDTGIGIPEEKLKDIFQMFMQADTSTTRRYGGTGLGLAICERLVAMMGGEIKVASARNHGSEFSFDLPFLPLAALPEPPSSNAAEAPQLARPPRILVVDDMETNRFLLEVFLRRNGFEADVASGGHEAIAKATTEAYDAILMDLQMPDIDGYTAAQRIRAAEEPGRHTPIIALTASIAKGTREKCLAAGMDEHLTKPLDLKRFKSLLHALLASAIAARNESAPARSAREMKN